MSFIPPENSQLPTDPDGRMRCTTLLQMRHVGLSPEEELAHLAAHARSCEAPPGVAGPSCPCPWCDALRHEYGRQMFRDREVRRFQLFDSEFHVGEPGEYDAEILQRLLDRSGAGWDDGALLEKPFAKGYFVRRPDGDGTLAQLIHSTDDCTADAARHWFEGWSEGPVEWLPAV